MIELARRRMMMMADEQPQYIQDGLIFRLDGIDKGATDGTWVDLVSGTVFRVLDGSVTPMANGFYFNTGRMSGAWNYGSNANYTIEVCYRGTIGEIPAFGVGGSNSNYPAFVYHNGNIMYLQQQAQYTIPSGVLRGNFTASCNTSIAKMNMTQLNRAGSDWWIMSPNTSTMYIGGGSGGGASNWRVKGTICAIRIYNRKLSADEMDINQTIDNIRFELGL